MCVFGCEKVIATEALGMAREGSRRIDYYGTVPYAGTVLYRYRYRTVRYRYCSRSRDAARDNPVKSQDGDIPGYPRDIEKRQDITIIVDSHCKGNICFFCCFH